jgi:small nuclear ribonucleoprotein (snRNP)-like protein
LFYLINKQNTAKNYAGQAAIELSKKLKFVTKIVIIMTKNGKRARGQKSGVSSQETGVGAAV